ncbi:MAG TPA: hypothetical protein VEL76_37025 [Gemmataceae bacterium]|nr:hypothetical protein [Gemmataceae bacterium]
MTEATKDSPQVTDKVQLAAQLFREFYASCFWHLNPDLTVIEAMIPLIIKGLRGHGGRKGFLAAAELAALEDDRHSCR